MGLRDKVPSFVREAWTGARPQVVVLLTKAIVQLFKILKNVAVCMSFWLVIVLFHWLVTKFPPQDTASAWVIKVIAYSELSSVALFLWLSFVDEFRK